MASYKASYPLCPHNLRKCTCPRFSVQKLEQWIRQIVFLRPGTFVVCDRVIAHDPDFRKTWLLQVMKQPQERDAHWVITHGQGRLFVQTLLPRDAHVRLHSGDQLYGYGGQHYPPAQDTGPAPECRMEVSPARPQQADWFLHVLTATNAAAESAPVAVVIEREQEVQIRIEETKIVFATAVPGGTISRGDVTCPLAASIRLIGRANPRE